ncbi:hypothetical protein L1987_80684 [Smallanthus sonchifolius]|uniref:Uncharacterized protein n=1 Tax=Smallanthus sonchifolius TaxID=185202 RepID=A0ACB8YPY2_9ASTR|nr:hypothetical protein L1987_80684 [Smallanthus sonchifolius]
MGYLERLMMTYKPGQLIVMYEKAAYVLSSNGPAIVLAKVDVDAKQNKERVGKYEFSLDTYVLQLDPPFSFSPS